MTIKKSIPILQNQLEEVKGKINLNIQRLKESIKGSNILKTKIIDDFMTSKNNLHELI